MAKKRRYPYVVVVNENDLVMDLVDELLDLHDENPLCPVVFEIPPLPEGIVYDDEEDGSQKAVAFEVAEQVVQSCGEDWYTYEVGCKGKCWWIELIPTRVPVGRIAQCLFGNSIRQRVEESSFAGVFA